MTLRLLNLHLIIVLLACSCTPVDRWPPPEVIPPASVSRHQTEPSSGQFAVPQKVPPEAADLKELSVENAVMLAFNQNRELQVEAFNPRISATFEQLERGTFDVELFALAQAGQEEAVELGNDTLTESDRSTLSAGVRKFSASGTTLELALSQNRDNDSGDGEEQVARIGLSVTQSLLRGFGPAVNLAALHQAQTETLASQDQLRGFSEALLTATETAYWNYVLTREEIAIFQASLEVARKQREEIEARIEVGILPDIEVAAAKAEEALRVQALLDARSQHEEARLRLISYISPTPESYRIKEINVISDPRLPLDPLHDIDDRIRLAEKSRADLSEARRLVTINQLETIVTRNGLLPRLDLFITLGKSGYADSFSQSFRQLSHEGYDFSAGINLSYLLGNQTAKARKNAAMLGRQQALAAVENLRQLVHLDVHLAYNEVERIRQQIEATRTTRHFQEQSFQAEQERFDVGTSTALLVAQAQRDLLEARISEIEAIVNYRIALVNLYLAEGSLLERRGISVNSTMQEQYSY